MQDWRVLSSTHQLWLLQAPKAYCKEESLFPAGVASAERRWDSSTSHPGQEYLLRHTFAGDQQLCVAKVAGITIVDFGAVEVAVEKIVVLEDHQEAFVP